MGASQACLAALVALACGCSLIYNPSNLPTVNPDADIDAKLVADADPSMLTLTHVTPSLLIEGEGTGGGRSRVLVVHGVHLVPGAQVAVALHGGGTAKVTVDNTAAQVSDDGYMVAVPIVVDVDPDLDAGMLVRLDVTVTQPNGDSTIAKTLDMLEDPAGAPVVQIKGLDELTGAAVALPSGVNEFSSVDITGGVTAATPANGPVIVRASSSVSITGTSHVNAVNKVGGAGAASGGTGQTALAAATPGMGLGGGRVSGGGGSYGSKGGGSSPDPVGTAALATLDLPNRGSGGAGGNLTVLGGVGGAGGGGGGSIEITAGGTLVLGTVEAKGGPGVNAGGDDGGGGSGGTILLRSGVSVMATAVSAAGGPAGGTGVGVGGDGRIRIDAPTMVPSGTTPELYRGPSFLADTPLITRNERPSFQVRGARLRGFSYFFLNAAQTNMRGPYTLTFSPSGDGEFQLEEALFEGVNLLCMQVEGAEIADQRPEARNCIEIVYLYVKPPGT